MNPHNNSKQPVPVENLYGPSAQPPTNAPPACPEHLNLCAEIFKRGAVSGLINHSSGTDEKNLELADLVHAEPAKVLVFFLSETKSGTFRRHVICDYTGENEGKRSKGRGQSEMSKRWGEGIGRSDGAK